MMSVFDRYYKRYDAWYDEKRFAYLSELELLKKVIPKRKDALEIGVGTGRFAGPLGIRNGVDPSEKMVEIARKRGLDVKLGCGEKLLFRSCVFDYAAIIITLCFVEDPAKVLRETLRVLKRNGKIVIGIIDKDSFLGKYYQKKQSVFYKHANFFSVKEVTDLLSKAGFSRFLYYQTLFHLPDEISCIEKSKKGFGEGGFVVIIGEKI